ncbi:hypothetical protein OGATHE_001832 [Ogataea polymorpha]|uniref:Uncharacterized protein n=1 Tax=Ogataea polymorpha TaxID=460523 RepID=A0A9P8PL50_9ASCO|nr:hypothetical protein OGATHE_001832 [Ogataea polymorpha]
MSPELTLRLDNSTASDLGHIGKMKVDRESNDVSFVLRIQREVRIVVSSLETGGVDPSMLSREIADLAQSIIIEAITFINWCVVRIQMGSRGFAVTVCWNGSFVDVIIKGSSLFGKSSHVNVDFNCAVLCGKLNDTLGVFSIKMSFGNNVSRRVCVLGGRAGERDSGKSADD